MTIIALLSPGAMGASVGAAAVSTGHEVMWLDTGRSERTRERAARGNLTRVTDEAEFFERADVLLSVCPPHSALEVAEQAVRNSFEGTYVEGNAISPKKTRSIVDALSHLNIRFVDGGIIGGPAWSEKSNTQFYLSGEVADSIANLFVGSPLNSSVVSDTIGAASALKMTFAAYSKGSTALLAAIMGVAQQEGVLEALQYQWGESFSAQTAQRVTGNATKAWRFAGEMDEIADTFSAAGLPSGFHHAAAQVFRNLSDYKDVESPPPIDDFLKTLLNKQ